MNISLRNIVDKIDHNLQLNSNRIPCSKCYYLCADKSKLLLLLQDETQVVMGRRGTGKTTIFKAFTYYVNKIDERRDRRAWYVSLDECVPSKFELVSNSADDITVYIFKSLLGQLLDFLYHTLEKFEKERQYFLQGIDSPVGNINSRINRLNSLIIKLAEAAEGSPKAGEQKMNVQSNLENESDILINANLRSKPKWGLNSSWKRNKRKFVNNSKEYFYKLDISEIKKIILDIFKEFGFKKVYICLDEFNMIDGRATISLQARVAQLIKQLFCGNSICVVKIANVWNENRMQRRQGDRFGLELGGDIFCTNELNLDTMFEHDNQQAYSFFQNMMLNDYMLIDFENDKTETQFSTEEKEQIKKLMLEKLFAKDAFRCLVCGSQGIPRIFGEILGQCLKAIKEANYQKVINVELVSRKIVDNYNTNVRRAIPCDSSLSIAIDDYISDTQKRFFLIKTSDYNKGRSYFDGLVATNALHQCPSEQVPRRLKNRYKVFFVHYGNYLEATNNYLKIIKKDSKTDNMLLYPDFALDIINDTQKYILNLPNDAFDFIYCDDCSTYFEKDKNVKNQPLYYECPKCNNLIRYWH